MRVFLATGEASGDMLGAALANAIRAIVPNVTFGGIGGERLAAAGVALSARTTGWAAMGPLESLRRIPMILWIEVRHALWFRRSPWDAIVYVDFGAAHLRVARFLRFVGYRRPLVYVMPPGVFLDNPDQARNVIATALPVTAFEHQRDFYRSLGYDIAYFGHPIASLVAPRAARPPAPADGGTIALLPGSRRAELVHILPVLLAAAHRLRAERPRVAFVISAADAEARASIEACLAREPLPGARIVDGARPALDAADVAWIASGTAVLEAALREVPCAALYVVAAAAVPIAHRMWKQPWFTLPNILLGRAVVPEFFQDAASPEALVSAARSLLADPREQLAALREVRARLGPSDALERCAAFIVAAARA